jgi:hypothetical protein
MRYGLIIFLVTGALLYNIYYDNIIVHKVKSNMKYIQMGGIAFAALSLYVFIRKNPSESGSMLKHATSIVQYMPIDSHSKDLLTPLFSMVEKSQVNTKEVPRGEPNGYPNAPQRVKRSVSESRKKFVASNQGWKCKKCNQILDATFEIDHVIELQYGGSNEVSNLEALCRNCHGKKSMMNRI